jgi:hypothetical protein
MKVFEIVVYAIAALALIVLFMSLMTQFIKQENPLDQIKKSIDVAQTQNMQGKTYQVGYLSYPSGFFTLTKDITLSDKVIISIECNDPINCCPKQGDSGSGEKCTKAVQWDYNFIRMNEGKKLLTSTRCIRIDGVPVCKIYFGSIPAQAAITKLELVGDNSGATQVKMILKNTGSTGIAYGTVSLNLYKKISDGWVLTDYNSQPKEVQPIAPQETQNVFWDISPDTIGDYKAEFLFEALNAGNDRNSIIFTKKTNSNCLIDETQTDTVQDPSTGLYQENHYCTGCNYSHECVGAWSKKLPGTTFQSYSKDQTYCTKTSYNGTC